MGVILRVQQTAETVVAEAQAGAFEPILLGLIVLLPLIGFAINGVAAILAARTAERRRWSSSSHHGGSEGEADEYSNETHSVMDAEPTGVVPWTHRLPSLVAPGVMLLAFALAVANLFGMMGVELEEPIVRTYWSWIPVGELQVEAALQLDQLSLLMTLVVTGVGALIHLFSVGYMSHDPGYPRYMAYLNLFVFFMLVLVLGASFPVMFVGWEGVGLCSYLLIGFWFSEKANADAGKKAFIVNRIGDFGFLIAMLLIFVDLGALGYVEVFERAPQLDYAGPVVTAICLFLFLGAVGKSAQIPLYVWLPDAMAGPTPVSALIHAATMVTAGVYLVVRASTLFAMAPAASLLVALVGAVTALFAATIGLKQWDIKKVLAYSTISQLGFMFAAVGMGAYVAGVFHLMTHAFFKACLFLGSGAVIHALHEAMHATHSHADAQDMRNMGGLRRYLPITFATMAIATLAIAGVAPFAGFFSKDEIVGAAWIGSAGELPLSQASLFGVGGGTWMGMIAILLSIAAFLTAFYMGRLMLYTFFGPNRTGEAERQHLHEVGWTMSVPLIVLAVMSTIGGFFNVDSLVPIVNLFSPFAFGGDAALHNWLHPVIIGAEEVWASNTAAIPEVHHASWPILLAILVGVAGLVLAAVVLKPQLLGTPEETPAYEGNLEKVLYNKWYVDELYQRIVVRPVWGLSRAFYSVVDRGTIDGIIDGVLGRGAMLLGLSAGRVQTGQVNTYAFIIIVGVIVVLGSIVVM
ncbi:MAG: NADH-quinone oxidoreductase subunit L [Gemmatimonas sp.]|nr:NADH-quinone oxidoreductase subunit L [Gemmatimonas sp.]